MIKVLQVVDTLRQRSGVTSVILNYLRNIHSDGLQIDVLVGDRAEPEMVKAVEACGAEVFFMPMLGLTNAFKVVRHLNAFFATHPYDIVHSHFNQLDFLLFPAARRHGVKHCISHSHNVRLSPNRFRAFRNRLLCWNIARNADTLAACSEAAGVGLFGKSFVASPRKLIVRNGVIVQNYAFNPEARLRIRQEFHIAPEETLLGHVGGFRVQKNHPFLIHLFRQLCNLDFRGKLLLVGYGDELPKIQKMVSGFGLDSRVVFAGVRSDIPEILSALDMFVFPSLFEGLGVALVEAQISGLPCMTSTTVPREVAFTDLVRFLPLDRGYDVWTNAIMGADCGMRRSRMEEAVAADYEISRTAKRLADYYLAQAESGH